jgi:hypothetical protein
MVGDGDPSRARQPAAARPGLERAGDRHGHHGRARREGEAKGSGPEGLKGAVRRETTLRKDHEGLAPVEEAEGGARGPAVGLVLAHGKRAAPADEDAQPWRAEVRLQRHVVERPVDRNRGEHGVHEGDVVRHEDDGARQRDVLDPVEADPEERPRETPHARTAELEEPEGHGAHPYIVTQASFS